MTHKCTATSQNPHPFSSTIFAIQRVEFGSQNSIEASEVFGNGLILVKQKIEYLTGKLCCHLETRNLRKCIPCNGIPEFHAFLNIDDRTGSIQIVLWVLLLPKT